MPKPKKMRAPDHSPDRGLEADLSRLAREEPERHRREVLEAPRPPLVNPDDEDEDDRR